jgi:hypothetical protein
VSESTSIDAPPLPRAEIETAFVGGEAVLLDTETGAVYSLNPSASMVWLLLDGVLSAAAIAEELSDIVNVPADALLPDVESAIGDFAERGLLGAGLTPQPNYFVPPPDP